MNSTSLLFTLALAGELLIVPRASAQTGGVNFPAASPACTLKQRVGIVPYDQVWRTGANQATKITFSTPVKLEGHDIPAGTYGLFTIPGQDQWTIIINKNANQWGSFQYNEKDDVVRFQVTPGTLTDTRVETFAIEFNRIRDESAVLTLVWDRTVVPIRMEVDVTSKLVPQIEAAMSAPGKKQDGFYFQAATFYYNHHLDLKKALDWVNTGLADNPRIAYEMLHLKAEILAKQGDKAGAVAAAKQSSELAVKAEGPGSSFVKMNNDLMASLQP